MLLNYLKVALRNIRKFKVFSLIKVFGLSIGLASCILIYLFVADELSFDKFHENGEDLYRVVRVSLDKDTGKETGLDPFLPAPAGPQLQTLFPEITHQSRFAAGATAVQAGDRVFSETVTLADSRFFEMFSFPLVSGTPQSALSNDQSAVLTQSLARKYFADENPIGKTLTLFFGPVRRDYLVAAVAGDPPSNSSLRFDLVIPFRNLPLLSNEPGILQDWSRWYCPLFVRLRPGVSSERMEAGLEAFRRQTFGPAGRAPREPGRDSFKLGLQKVEAMHLDTRVAGTPGRRPSVLLSAIALAVLLIACVNFMTLSIGMASARAKEVGLRKVVGARRKQIIGQLTCEALVISQAAVLIGIVIAELLIPGFNAISGRSLSSGAVFKGTRILVLPALALLAGLMAGLYPAFLMSAFRPVEIMKGRLKVGGNAALTSGLVVLQFALSVVLAVSAITLGRQVSYLMKRDLGYAKDGLIVVRTQENDPESSERVNRLFRDEIIARHGIRGLAASSREFGLFLPSTGMTVDGRDIRYRFNRVDPAFLSTMGIPVVQGRDFSSNPAADQDAVIVNRKFIDELGAGYGLGDVLGDAAKGFPQGGRIVGIVGNSHIRSLREDIEPLLLYVGRSRSSNRDRFSCLFIRVETDEMKGILDVLGKAWKKIQPEKPFDYYFQDEALERMYDDEKRLSAVVRPASVLSLVLACLGIFGLTALALSRRRKEIGIRKVLGAGAGRIICLGIKKFIALIAVANAIAWPVVFVLMKGFLRNYPYRVGIGLPYFVLAGAASILIAVLTILYLSVKAALADPVECMKCE